MKYTVVILPRAEKELRKVPRETEKRILERLRRLENDFKETSND
jgi:mRNA-degrading endonuclease RelE of RelBE toxin-antitoxin system